MTKRKKKRVGATKFEPVFCKNCGEPRYPFDMLRNRPESYTCQRCQAIAAGLPNWRPSKGSPEGSS